MQGNATGCNRLISAGTEARPATAPCVQPSPSASSLYWDINKPKSYNCLFNFIVGMRGNGKTYGTKQDAIKDFIKTGTQFIYLRRYKEELRKVRNKYFDDIRENFPDHDLTCKGGNFYIDGKIAGYTQALSTSKIEKSNPFPFVGTIIFDEFIIDKGVYHYLPDEVTYFLEFYSTVARQRDVRVWFLSNAITMVNPYFTYFNIQFPTSKTKIWRNNEILLQITENKELEEKIKHSRFGSIINNTAYGKYAIENEFFRDNYTFVEKRSKAAEYYCTFIYNDKKIGVWADYESGYMYFTDTVDTNYLSVYSVTNKDHGINTLLLKGQLKPTKVKNILLQYQLGNVRFESLELKETGFRIMQAIGGV